MVANPCTNSRHKGAQNQFWAATVSRDCVQFFDFAVFLLESLIQSSNDAFVLLEHGFFGSREHSLLFLELFDNM